MKTDLIQAAGEEVDDMSVCGSPLRKGFVELLVKSAMTNIVKSQGAVPFERA